jgi:hypothetical protein
MSRPQSVVRGRTFAPVAPARLAAWAGSLVRTRSRGERRVREADHRALTWRRARDIVISAGLALLFLVKTVEYVATRLRQHPADGLFWPGSDTRIYYRAAEAWLHGGDPWAASYAGVAFGAPPPTLLAVAPFVPMGEGTTVVVWSVGLIVLAAIALWRVRLPLWWLLWPPVFEGLWVGSLDLAVIALLLIPGLGVIAAVAKVFGAVPLAILGRWRPVVALAGTVIVTAPFLPWGPYLDHGAAVIAEQNPGGYSAWAVATPAPTLLVVVAVALALVVLGRRRSAWLAVPALWPYTQMHYSVLALPAITPVLAIAMSFRSPWTIAAAVIFEAVLRAQIPSMVRRYCLVSAAVSVPR